MTIYINSPTFDLITKDAKTTFMDRLAVIGGTLGLFTGFSVISGIEVFNEILVYSSEQLSPQIIYFLLKIVLGSLESAKKRRLGEKKLEAI